MTDFEKFKNKKQVEEIKGFIGDLKEFTIQAEEVISKNKDKLEADNDE